MTLINKSFKLSINPVYFIVVLLIRGSISALFKELYVKSILKKPLKFRKPKINFLFITLPSLTLYLLMFGGRIVFSNHYDIEAHLTHFFITFMVVSRCLRALVKIFNRLTANNNKNNNKKTIIAADKLQNMETPTSI